MIRLRRAFNRNLHALLSSRRSRYRDVPGTEALEVLRDPLFRESWEQFRRGEGVELRPEIRSRCDD